MLIVCLIFLFISILFSNKIYKSFLNPINLFVGVNLISIIFMYAISTIDDVLSIYLWILIFIMMVFYMLGLKFENIRTGTLHVNNINLERKISNMKRLENLIIGYSIIFDIFAFYYLYHLNSAYGIKRMLQDLSGINSAIQTGEFETGIYSYFTPIGIPLSLMILFFLNRDKEKNKRKKWLYLQYILCYVPCISPRRDMLFFMVGMTVLYLGTQFSRNIKIKNTGWKKLKKAILIIGIVVAAIWLMSYTQELMNKSLEIELDFRVFGFELPNWLTTPIVYVAGNYAYLQKMYEVGDLKFSFPLISTFRLLYRYLGPYLGIYIDTTTDFALKFYDIGVNQKLIFNTAPILYYIIRESGICFFIIFFIIGMLSMKAYKGIQYKNSIGRIMLGIFQFDIICFSFRSYNLISLSYVLTLVYIVIAYLYVDRRIGIRF